MVFVSSSSTLTPNSINSITTDFNLFTWLKIDFSLWILSLSAYNFKEKISFRVLHQTSDVTISMKEQVQ
jgi:hypothetical protein